MFSPFTFPPLRERRDDIPILVRYFVDKYAKTMNRKIERIPESVMDALTRYAWPGNIRELQNFHRARRDSVGGLVIAAAAGGIA